ncbi:unnamed protein product, partial [Iphiclides podalirius]
MAFFVPASADHKFAPLCESSHRTDAVSFSTGSAPRRRDDHNPPPCVGGHFEPGTEASVGTGWPSAGCKRALAL